jgi:hypothetical protein
MYTPNDKTPRQPDFVGETVSVFGSRKQAEAKAAELAALVPDHLHRHTFVTRKEFNATEGWFRYEVKVDGWYDPPHSPV